MIIITPFFMFLAFAIALVCFRRARTVLCSVIGFIGISIWIGTASNPSAVWAVIFAATIFIFFVWLIVRAMANSKKKRDEKEDRALETLQRQFIARQNEKTFGKFRPRG